MILHVDMDAFYASVEIRDRPELAKHPVIVGGTPDGRGVVCAANYIAREYGVHSAMSAARAKRLCPDAVFLRPRMEYYAAISRQIRDIFHQKTPLVEPLSLDEAFLDVTGSENLFGSSEEIGRQIKREILKELHLVASVGVAHNKFLAKLASDLDKPDGFVVVDPNRVQEFLDPLDVGRLWGVGKATRRILDRLSVRTIGDLRKLPKEVVQTQFGDHGGHLHDLSFGIDDRRVVPDREAKSISHETTFADDIGDLEELRAWMIELTDQVARRLRQHGLKGNTVQLKVRYSDFQTLVRSSKLNRATDVTQEIWQAADEMLSNRLQDKPLRVRLLGVGVSGFSTAKVQMSLFDEEEHQAQASLDQMADQIRDKFGNPAIGRASSLLRRKSKE